MYKEENQQNYQSTLPAPKKIRQSQIKREPRDKEDSPALPTDRNNRTFQLESKKVYTKSGDLRKRPASACVSCRKRKIRCTGLEPCGACRKGGRECKFQKPSANSTRCKELTAQKSRLAGELRKVDEERSRLKDELRKVDEERLRLKDELRKVDEMS
jgi:hypothetical protein